MAALTNGEIDQLVQQQTEIPPLNPPRRPNPSFWGPPMSIFEKFAILYQFFQDAERLSRHEYSANIWTQRYEQYGGVMLHHFIENLRHWLDGPRQGQIRGLFKLTTLGQVQHVLNHPQFQKDLELTLASLEFEELVYIVFVKMHELHESLQINLAAGYVTMDHALHHWGRRAKPKGFHRNGLPILSPFTVRMMISELQRLNEKYFEDREFLTNLERGVKPRKIDELKEKILSSMSNTTGIHTEIDRNRAVMVEATRRTGHAFRDIKELERIAPGLYHFDHINPANLAKRVYLNWSRPPQPVSLIQAKVLGPSRYRPHTERPSSAVTVVRTSNAVSASHQPQTDRLDRTSATKYEQPIERQSAATTVRSSNAASSSHQTGTNHLEHSSTTTSSYVQAGGDTPLSQRPLIDIELPSPSNENTFSMSKDELFSRLPPNIVPRPPKKEKRVEKLLRKVDDVRGKTKEKIAKVGEIFELREKFKKD